MSELKNFLEDVGMLSGLSTSHKYQKLVLTEYPFDAQLLKLSRLYRVSRGFYLSLGGLFSPKICSTMRSLSAQDLFKDEIEFSPASSELLWFKNHYTEVTDPEAEITALMRFSDISLFHEQNHRVLWRLLPPAPQEEFELRRYLNFAESLVVTLDIALGDEVGPKLSPLFERMNLLYRSGVKNKLKKSKSKKEYRHYLLSVCCATYMILELVHTEDILKALDYILPGQKKINKDAVRCSLELNEHFTRITNPQWQELHSKSAAKKLKKIHRFSKEEILYLPEDPLDLQREFIYMHRVFDYYGL